MIVDILFIGQQYRPECSFPKLLHFSLKSSKKAFGYFNRSTTWIKVVRTIIQDKIRSSFAKYNIFIFLKENDT